jgi:EmrB/QacA subfamily drug resistance transporter
MTENITTRTAKSTRELIYLILVLGLGVFMTAIDSYIFVPALPTIVRELNTSLDWVSWTMTIFMLFMTAVMPLGGKLSDTYGRKKIYIAGVGLFTLGSLLSSVSWDIYSLIAFRGVQAIGAGLVFPAAIAAIGSAAPEDNKGKTMGLLMAIAAVAMVVGPNIGGYIIQHFGWRMVFYINIPLGVLAILATSRFNETFGEARRRIDVIGAALLTAGLGALMLGLVRFETLPFWDLTVFPCFVACGLLGLLLTLYELRVPEPILDISLILRPGVLALNLSQLAITISLVCAMFYVPSFAQYILRMNVQDSGTILTPLSVSLMVAAIAGGIIMDRIGAKIMIVLGGIVTTAAIFYLTGYVTDSMTLAIALAAIGIGLGLGMGAFQLVMLSWMPESEKGTGTGILGTFKNVGSTIGSVIGGFVLSDATRHVITLDQAFHNVFWIGVYMAIVSVGLAIAMIVFSRRYTVLSNPSVPEA